MYEENILINNILNGDIDSFSALVNRYQNRLFKFLLGLTFCREDAEEILQDVFIRAYNYMHKYNCKWSFSTWIHKIAINTFKDFYKQKRKKDFVEYHEDLSLYKIDSGVSIDQAYESKELYKEVVEQINKLKSDYKIALILRCAQGFSYQDISKIMGVSVENAKTMVCRSRQTISNGLKMKRGVNYEL
ncbi:MAG: RNA polymerase sigma factor [Bacillota bacterium]|nr:RNA polymerase sigma factor [Bacillota bacterium]